MKKLIFAGLFLIVALALLIGCTDSINPKEKPTTLIFKLNGDYSSNYLGPVNYYADTNTYRSVYTLELFDYCYMVSENNEVYDDITGEKVFDGVDNEKEVCFKMSSPEQLKNGGVKKLSNEYYAVIYPAVDNMVEKFVVLDKSIITQTIHESERLSFVPENFPNNIKPGMGDSIDMSREEFYSYVLEENPLLEAYFCNEPEENLNAVSISLYNGETPKTCTKII